MEVKSLVGVEVRRVHAAEWKELREVRLRALADAPDAFASTLEREAAFPEEVWRQRAHGGPASASFIVREDGVGVGTAACSRVGDEVVVVIGFLLSRGVRPPP